MKKGFLSCLLVAALAVCAVPAMAVSDIQSKTVFDKFSSAVATSTNSTYVDTGLRTKKTIIINGYKTNSTFGNFSGTFVLKGGPTSNGPWVTLKDVNGNAVSATTNTIFTVNDLSRYVMGTYTRNANGKGAKKVSVWLYYAE